jgi:hypothetical protein
MMRQTNLAQRSFYERKVVVRRLLATTGVALLLACQKTFPVAPSDLTTGIIVYEHADYRGASAHITQDIADLKDFKGPCLELETGATTRDVWNDCISSVRVAPGWWARLYRDDGFDGDRIIAAEDIPNLQSVTGGCEKGGFNDCTTSIRLFRQ